MTPPIQAAAPQAPAAPAASPWSLDDILVVLVLDKTSAANLLGPLLAQVTAGTMPAPPFAGAPDAPTGGTTDVPVPGKPDELSALGVSQPHEDADKAAALIKNAAFYDAFKVQKAMGK